jgi:membrane-bound metal-dependent hydrolase YbcI (DUF457 family)
MADGKTHVIWGTGAGVVTAFATATRQDTVLDSMLLALAGGGGGALGSRIPDIFEPALHSHHRDIAHSWTMSAAMFEVLRRRIERWRDDCVEKARTAREQRYQLDERDCTRIQWLLVELFWTIARSFVPALAVGYLSHLALDAQTPRGLPLIKRPPPLRRRARRPIHRRYRRRRPRQAY